jgi:peptidoglycan/LPS O-acetylase OafA/YrhL
MKEKEEIRSYFNLVRAVAILEIFFYHIYDFSYGGFGSVAKRFREGLLQNLFSGADSFLDYLWGLCQLEFSFGNKGVELFIIASGFGLYLSYLEKRTSWVVFYKKRVLRVLPLYWAACVVIYAIFPVTTKHLVTNVLLVQIFTRELLVFGPLWFISYLFVLYIMFPLFVFVFRNAYAKWGLFAVSFFLTPLWDSALGLLGFVPVGVAPTEYVQVFLLGMLLADSVHNGRTVHRCVLNASVGALAIVFFATSVYLVSYHISLTPIMHRIFGILIFLSIGVFVPLIRRFGSPGRAVDWLAYGAYTIYLSHALIFIKVLFLADKAPWLRWVLIYPRAEFRGSPLKFISTALVLLAVTVLVSFAIQRAYDRLAGRLTIPPFKFLNTFGYLLQRPCLLDRWRNP